MIYELGDKKPQVAEGCYIADNATVVGDVVLKSGATVWFNAVLRGDMDQIVISEGSNVQDNAVLHTDPNLSLMVGKNVTIGHKVMLHGCQIADNSLIGIGAIVLNGARIGRHCIIGAGALVTEGKEIPDNSLVMGAPGKVVRTLSDQDIMMIKYSAEHYTQNGQRFQTELKSVR